jgi:hypothetical protein
MTTPPDDLRDLDAMLRQVQFEPRASLGAEIEGRFRRGEQPRRPPLRIARFGAAAALVSAGMAALWLVLIQPQGHLTVDQCCQDLDGGGDADDGVRVVSRGGTEVKFLQVYEDVDGSGSYTPGDRIRYEREAGPALTVPIAPGAKTVELCCLDYDGGGPDDDALMIVSFPPDRISMAAIIERGAGQQHPAPLR